MHDIVIGVVIGVCVIAVVWFLAYPFKSLAKTVDDNNKSRIAENAEIKRELEVVKKELNEARNYISVVDNELKSVAKDVTYIRGKIDDFINKFIK